MKERSDKKIQTKPYVAVAVLSNVRDMKDHLKASSNAEVARRIVLEVIDDWTVLRRLQPFLRWDYVRGDHVLVGHANHAQITSMLPGQFQRTERLPIRFTQHDSAMMETLHACLACPLAHMVGALLKLGIDSPAIVERVAPGYVTRSEHSFRKGVFNHVF